MDEWEIPEEVLLFAASEDGMHQCFVINYGLSTFPEGAVLYVDTDPDGCVIPVAESVDAFLSKLSPYPDQLETVEDTEPSTLRLMVRDMACFLNLSERLYLPLQHQGSKSF